MAADGSNDDLGWYVMCFSKQKASLIIHMPFECLDYFNLAANFQDGRHGLRWNPIICFENDNRQSKKIIRW